MRSLIDVLLFSIKPEYLKITRIAKRENSSEFYLLIAMLCQYWLHLCVLTHIPAFWRGWEYMTWMCLPHHHSRVHRLVITGCFNSIYLIFILRYIYIFVVQIQIPPTYYKQLFVFTVNLCLYFFVEGNWQKSNS